MSKLQDPKYLLNEQYKNAKNLNARIRIHAEFSTNDYGWFRWIFDHYDFPQKPRILELGCGPADLWCENLPRIPLDWEITLSDFSAGMIEQAKNNLAAATHPFKFEVINAQSIPYEDEHFDIVIANHCIYHFPDRPKALAEIQRVLKTGGRFHATTIGEKHLAELPELITKFDPEIEDVLNSELIPFTLQNGQAQLEAWFSDVSITCYSDELQVTDAEVLADYILSSIRLSLQASRRAALIGFIKNQFAANDGMLRITKESGLFIGRKA